MGRFQYDLWITDRTAEGWYGGIQHDTPELIWCLGHLREGMKVADCGTHHGCVAVVFSKAVGPSGAVWAWDALAHNAAIASQNLELNLCTNGVVRPFGLGDAPRVITMPVASSNTIVQWTDQIIPDYRLQTIEIVRLDDELSEDTVIDFLKIDVEGSELQMLRGATRTLSRRPIIDLEIHNFTFHDRMLVLNEIFGILRPLQYSYALLPHPFESAIQPVGWDLDLSEVARHINPHVFCLPVW